MPAEAGDWINQTLNNSRPFLFNHQEFIFHSAYKELLFHCKVELAKHLPDLLGGFCLLLFVGGAGLLVHPLGHVQQPGVWQDLPAKLKRKILDYSSK